MDDTIYNESPDDMLEATRHSPLNGSVGDSQLEQAYQRSAEPADNPFAPQRASDHPRTDSNQDITEIYDEGDYGVAYTPLRPQIITDEDNAIINRGGDL